MLRIQKLDAEVLQEIGYHLKNRRKWAKMNQTEFADHIGVSRSTLSDLENGKGCHLKYFVKVLKYFQLEESILERLYVTDIFPKNRFYQEHPELRKTN